MVSLLKTTFSLPDIGVVIREAGASDFSALVELLEILFSLEADFRFDARRQRRGLNMLHEDHRSCILVAEYEGVIVGMCTGQMVISTAEGGMSVLVEDVVVLPRGRGHGIGTLLLDALCRWAFESGAQRLQLLADCDNSGALDFYKKNGWETTRLVCLRKRKR